MEQSKNINVLSLFAESASRTQRYKMIGNGWTVDVIAHIFSYMKL